MKKWNKVIACASALLMTVTLALGASAAKASDYTACKYGKVADAGADTVTVSGKGYLGTTAAQGVNAASAAMYSNQIDPRNISFTLNFLNDYGKGEGAQSGWYAFNLSATKDWFSSLKPVIAKNNVKGVVVIFKLNPNDKKELILELSRYAPGSGFTNIFGQSIKAKMKNDWKCDVEIKNGKLKIDGTDIMDLSDSLALTVGEGKGYVGFGGFSENHYDIAMNVTMKDAAPPTSSTASKPQPTSSAATSKPPTGDTSKTASQTSSAGTGSQVTSETSQAASETDSGPAVSTDSSAAETPVDSQGGASSTAGTDSQPEDDNASSQAAAGEEESKGGAGWIIGIVIAAVVVIGGGVAGFFIYQKKKAN